MKEFIFFNLIFCVLGESFASVRVETIHSENDRLCRRWRKVNKIGTFHLSNIFIMRFSGCWEPDRLMLEKGSKMCGGILEVLTSFTTIHAI